MTDPYEIRTGIPRCVEVAFAIIGIVLTFPLTAVCALAIFFSSGRPILFRQQRIGLNGTHFELIKFRSMHVSNNGPSITTSGDLRVTRVGRLLRSSKLDELPEFWNILKGEMSFVGPRPEVPQFVDTSDPAWRHVLRVRPGLTDPVTIGLRHEESLLASVEGDRERFYRSVLLPLKLKGYANYMDARSFFFDLKILAKTVGAILSSEKMALLTTDQLARQAERDRGSHSIPD